eukprot:SAG31_NODE_25055_length_468_cov_190.457995_1_plen_27_part_10
MVYTCTQYQVPGTGEYRGTHGRTRYLR